jgi:hypothetical protein
MAEPVCKHLGGAIVEQVNRPMRLEIDKQCAIAALFSTQGNVINAKHSRTMLRFAVSECMEQAKQRIWTDRHARFARQTSATFATSLQCERRQQLSRVVCAPGIAGQYTIEALGEDLSCALRHIAEPPSAVDSQTYGVTAPGQIAGVEGSCCAAGVVSLTARVARRARRTGCPGKAIAFFTKGPSR